MGVERRCRTAKMKRLSWGPQNPSVCDPDLVMQDDGPPSHPCYYTLRATPQTQGHCPWADAQGHSNAWGEALEVPQLQGRGVGRWLHAEDGWRSILGGMVIPVFERKLGRQILCKESAKGTFPRQKSSWEEVTDRKHLSPWHCELKWVPSEMCCGPDPQNFRT